VRQELKIKISNTSDIIARIELLGASFVGERRIIDTYFCQTDMGVLKIAQDESGVFLLRLKPCNGGFSIKPKQRVENLELEIEKLSELHGIETVLEKTVKHYRYKDYDITINEINGVGDFLVIEGEQIEEELFTQFFDILEPQFVRVPFSKLPKVCTPR
jgi:adenylate cyclase class IV